jgi:hypothetical protein
MEQEEEPECEEGGKRKEETTYEEVWETNIDTCEKTSELGGGGEMLRRIKRKVM